MQDKIIFVDDQRGILESLKWLFTDGPYHIEAFESPSEALFRLKEAEPAVIVSDQYMPGMVGTDFLEGVKKRWPRTIRIIMTVDPGKTVLEALSRGNIHGIISKPWNPTELKQTIRNAVNQYKSHWRLAT
jgi:DNA-binding NtrC family response regulator